MKTTTKTYKLERTEIRKIINMTIKWCQANLGTNNRRKNKFRISVRKNSYDTQPLMGTFCPYQNCLSIYYGNNPTVKDLIQTTIHEYTHYLQPIRTYYFRIAKFVPYHLHPMELEACINEEKYFKQCKNYLKNNLS